MQLPDRTKKNPNIKKYFFDENLISKSWVMKIFSEKFSRWGILEIFQLKSNFSRFFDFRKFSIEIQLFSIFRFSQDFSKLIFRRRKMILTSKFHQRSSNYMYFLVYHRNFRNYAGNMSGIFFSLIPWIISGIRGRDLYGWPRAKHMSCHVTL